MKFIKLFPYLALLIVFGMTMTPVQMAQGANGSSKNNSLDCQTFQVTKTADTNDGACSVEDCSLREAMIAANTHSGADVIALPAGTYMLTIPGTNEGEAATGGLDILDDLTITGEGRDTTIIDGGKLDSVFVIISFNRQIQVNLNGITIQNGMGGISSFNANLNLDHITVKNNAGTGIWGDSGDITIRDSLITGNITPELNFIGGVRESWGNLSIFNSTISNNTGSWGGISSDVSTEIDSSTISGNTGTDGPGGMRIVGSLILTNSTVSGNQGTAGAGIWTNQGAEITNSTITHNTSLATGDDMFANGQGGGIYFYGDGEMTLVNTIVSQNSSSAGSPDCYGPLTSAGYNLIGTTLGCAITTTDGDVVGSDPRLGPLQDNGGATSTQALLPGSPAINAGTNLSCPPTDQRGILRPVDGTCDIGAYEFEHNGDYHLYLPGVYRTMISTITGQVLSTGGQPLAGVTVQAGTATTTTDSNGAYAFTLPAGTYTIVLPDTPEQVSYTATIPPAATAVDFAITDLSESDPCTELLDDPGFEESDLGDGEEKTGRWVFPITVYRAGFSTTVKHSGDRSARVGIDKPGDDIYSYSSVRQTVSIPDDADELTIEFYLYRYNTDPKTFRAGLFGSSVDLLLPDSLLTAGTQYVILYDANTGERLVDLLAPATTHDPHWKKFTFTFEPGHATYNLDRIKGRKIRLLFGASNYSGEGITAMYIDDVSMSVCQ